MDSNRYLGTGLLPNSPTLEVAKYQLQTHQNPHSITFPPPQDLVNKVLFLPAIFPYLPRLMKPYPYTAALMVS